MALGGTLVKGLLVVGGLVLTVGAASYSLGISKLQSECGILYTVVAGDGCVAIAASAKITQAQLAALNPSVNCTKLAVGQGLCLALPCSKTYIVASGDWCAKIEKDQNVTEPVLLSLNPGLACGDIFAGQRLCIAPPVVDPSPPSDAPPPIDLPNDPVPTVPCQVKLPITEGDTCYNLAVEYGIQLSQFMALNANLVCKQLQAGDIACVLPACGSVYKVQNGDWCAKIEGDFSLKSGQLVALNPGLSCTDLAADQTLCVAPAVEVVPDDSVPTYTPRDAYPVFSPGKNIPQSPIASYLNANDTRNTFAGDIIFQHTSSHMSTFSRADINRDGVLDINELRTLIAVNPSSVRGVTGINDAEHMAQQIMTSSDTNGDGKISQDEYMSAVGQAQQATTEASLLAAQERRELGHLQKRVIPLLILGLIGLLVIASFATMMGEMERKSRQQAGELLDYLDITFWDRDGGYPEPECSAYMYYSSSCAVLGNSWSSNCSEGGEKVYEDSCQGLFTDGAKACGFLGCSSLCYKINTEGCSCDALKYTAEEGYYYSDSGVSTTTESGVAACRSKCSNLNGCVGFSVTPASTDDTLTCKIFKSMTTKVQQERAASFKLIGLPVGSPGNPICPVVPQGYAPRPVAQMQQDQLWGEFRSWSYSKQYSSGTQEQDAGCPTGPPQKRSLIPSVLEQRNERPTVLKPSKLSSRALDTVDLRSTYGTTVKTQGQSNTCVSFTMTTLVEATIKRAYRRIGVTKDLSPLWIHSCRAGTSTNLGTTFADVNRWVGNSYLATESCMPWVEGGRPYCQDNLCAASQYGKLPYITSTKSFSWLNPYELLGGVDDIEGIKDWIKNNGPVYMSFTVNNGFQKYAENLHTNPVEEVFYDAHPSYPASCGYGNHAMTVVGYSHYTRPNDPCKTGPRLYWIVQNSWGSQSGKNGHVFIELGSLANTIGYEPAYGVKVNEGQQWLSSTLPVD